MQVFIDADFLLDAVVNRFQGNPPREFWDALQRGIIRGYLTRNGLNRIYECMCTLAAPSSVEAAINEIQAVIEIHLVDRNEAFQAQRSSIKDYESALEVACATQKNIGAIVTHRPQDFIGANLLILSPEELLKRQKLEQATIVLPSINLSDLFQSYSKFGWKPAEQILNRHQQKLNFRHFVSHSPRLGKLLNPGSVDQIALVIRLTPIQGGMDIWAELWVAGNQKYLPRKLEFAVLSEAGEVALSEYCTGIEESISLNFRANRSEQFCLRASSGATSISEMFIV